MATVNISLPESLKSFVEDQVHQGGYSTVSEYFRDLLRQAQKRAAEERLETLLLEGLASGAAADMTEADWEDIRRQVRERIGQTNAR